MSIVFFGSAVNFIYCFWLAAIGWFESSSEFSFTSMTSIFNAIKNMIKISSLIFW